MRERENTRGRRVVCIMKKAGEREERRRATRKLRALQPSRGTKAYNHWGEE
jgi:hypothetical protein